MPKTMGADFDVSEFCRKLKNSKAPPYQCPVVECGRTYKSICGIRYHLSTFDHNNPMPVVTPVKKKKGRLTLKTPSNTSELLTPVVREALTYAEAQKIVEFEVDGRAIRVDIIEPIPVISKQEYDKLYGANDAKDSKSIVRPEVKVDETKLKLPEPAFSILDSYNIPDALPRPKAYIRFIERSADELDGEVEYDLDEEDCAWLGIINEKRAETGLPPIPVDTFELLMDRLEKESYFQMANSKSTECGSADDDAVCCICMDGECQNTNVILFCDMCNLAVHQDCYGVPYIPEGQWLCRRCLQSPSRAVDCVLCPNNGGAFKQTDRRHWAHVVCALWIPEVRFANTVFLEPIDSIETIPPARWKLTCYICKQRGVGACIQCHKTNCYAAFHVTCAQHTGLYMKMDTVKDSSANGEHGPVMVQKTAYCDAHTPADAEHRPRLPQTPLSPTTKVKDESKSKMKKARRILAKKRTSVPVISIPTIPPDKIQEIGALITVPKKSQFIQRLIAYWTLKRQFRNGVPLLRRLQSSHLAKRDDGKLITELGEFFSQIKYLQCLRQDLEKARLLCELVRKREKKKNEYTRAKETCTMVELFPMKYFLTRIWELVTAKDTQQIFTEPVDQKEVPDYGEVVKHPMDFSTMKSKIDNLEYWSIDDFEKDFNLMISNCLAYNAKDTIFYKAGLRMRDQGGATIKAARKDAEIAGLDESTGLLLAPGAQKSPSKANEDKLIKEIDAELFDLETGQLSIEEHMIKLMKLADQAQNLKQGPAKTKRCKLIKGKMTKLKRKVSMLESSKKLAETEKQQEKKEEKKNESSESSSEGESSSSEDKPLVSPAKKKVMRKRSVRDSGSRERESKREKLDDGECSGGDRDGTANFKAEVVTPNKSSVVNGDAATVSPSGVNRRTAVLFTRKAQAAASAFKKPEAPAGLASPLSPGKRRRGRQGRPRKNLDAALAGCQDDGNLSNKDDITVPCSDSFRVYRSGGEIPQETDEETQSESSCSSCSSGSEGSSSCSSSDVDLGGDGGSSSDEDTTNEGDSPAEPALQPLDLVWAKCRGYPWYPALIINPKMPRNYVHNGVPIPAPPADVLALANSYTEPVYLVLFFDTKRTWQWLPRNKLELLGTSSELDQSKLNESRKPTDRKAVRKAYQEALLHRCQVDQKKTPTQNTV